LPELVLVMEISRDVISPGPNTIARFCAVTKP